MGVQYQSCTCDNGTSFFKYGAWHGVRTYAGTDRRIDSHVTIKMFEINGLPIFQSMVPRSLAFGAQAAPLLIQCCTLLKKKSESKYILET